ncbi:MAG: ribonucrease, partial [Streptomycetaceae bacterium]|nr:ribonucrease [Streptomycetaceae bacterium]
MGIALGTGSVFSVLCAAVTVAVAMTAAVLLRRLRHEREQLRTAAECEAREIRATAKDEIREIRGDLERREQRLSDREARIDAESEHLRVRRRELADEREALDRRRAELSRVEEEQRGILERVAFYTAAEARADLVRSVEQQAKREAAVTVRDIERAARERGEERARRIVSSAIQRVASEQTAEAVVSVLQLPSDEMKGRIIGREGRNIRAFEALTGVNLIIDDMGRLLGLSDADVAQFHADVRAGLRHRLPGAVRVSANRQTYLTDIPLL